MPDKLPFSPIDELHASYKTREVSPVEVLEATLERLEQLEPRLNAFITTLFEEARGQAKKAEELFSKEAPVGKLAGVPVSVKDIFATEGIRTTVGSRIMEDHVPDYDSYVYSALKRAGAVVFGKNNMLEFAYGFMHSDYGQCNNPWDTNRTAGGSSSGSASSVCAGIGYASVGTDTGGSIRIPASFCGIVGLKPTYEAVSRDGCFPLSHTLDHVGPLTRTVRDNAAIMEVLAPTISLSGLAAGEPVSRIRVGVISNLMGDPVGEEVKTLVQAAIDRIGGLVAEVTDVSLPGVERIDEVAMPILLAEASYYHRRWFPERTNDYAEGTRANLAAGLEVPAVDYVAALRERESFTKVVEEVLREVDVLVCPTAPFAATETDPDFEGGARDYILRTVPFDVTGHPALTIPAGNTVSQNLPAGIQLVAAHRREDVLYRLAAAYEEEVGGFSRPSL